MQVPTFSPVQHETVFLRSGLGSFRLCPSRQGAETGEAQARTFRVRYPVTQPAARPPLSFPAKPSAQHTLHDASQPNPVTLRQWEVLCAWDRLKGRSGKKLRLTPSRMVALEARIRNADLNAVCWAIDEYTDPGAWHMKKNAMRLEIFLGSDEEIDTYAVRSRWYNDGHVHTWPARYAATNPRPE